jgi:hypothetical protein
MDPRLCPSLRFTQLARYLSVGSVQTMQEIRNDLISAMWRGELATMGGEDEDPTGEARRKRLLDAMAKRDDHPGIVFLRPGEIVAPEQTENPDGSVTIDLKIRITWPVDEKADEELAFEAATDKIAAAGLDDYAEICRPGLVSRQVSREAFGAYCDQQGLERPKFWFPKSARGTARAAGGVCTRWLKDRIAKAKLPIPKKEMRAEAMKKFGVSGREFDRLWELSAPVAWKAPGRKSNRDV